VNRAVSGDRVTDLYARVREDIVNVQPDILSILVGVNDVWSQYKYNRGNNTAKFERIYDLLLDEVCTELPEMKLMLLEPYVLNGPGTCSDAESPGRWEYMQKEVAAKSDVVKGLAEKYHAVFVPLQAALNEAAEKVSVEYWLYDGVHPTSAGHDLIKRQWVKGFERLRASEA
jgi:lysophospholipase L1-like esterase